MMNYILQFIKPELLILIPVLYLIGIGIKKSKVADKWIPLILGGLAVLLACLYVFALEPIESAQVFFTALFTGITQGILCAGASVYINQITKQAKKHDESDKDDKEGE